MHVQIKQRLFILVAVALIALLGMGTFSYFQAQRLEAVLSETITRQTAIIDAVDKARGAQVHFKTQVQEWKNILLRGKDPEAFEKHLKSFNAEEKLVQERLAQVKATAVSLAIAEQLNVDSVEQTFAKLAPAYRDALSRYDRASPDPAAVVDKLVRGIDRAPAQAIDNLVGEVQKISAEI